MIPELNKNALTSAIERIKILEAERDAAVAESNRRDQKWMEGIDTIVGRKLRYTLATIMDAPDFDLVPDLQDFIADLRARLQTAEQQLARFEVKALGKDAQAVLDEWIQKGGLLNDPALGILQATLQAFIEQQLGQVREKKDGLILDCERLATDLEQACRQWKMYAEECEDEDLEKESHVEAVSYRAAVKTAKNWRDKAFTLMHPNLSPATPSDGCGKGRTDKERLDWLANNDAHVASPSRGEFIVMLQNEGGEFDRVTKRPFPNTFREAIDKAMEAASSKGKGGGE